MGGMKDAIHVLHDQIETALVEALPERIYRQLEIGTDGHALIIRSRDLITLVAEVSVETETVVVADLPQYAKPNRAVFMGTDAVGAAGNYMAYLLKVDE
jgi:hypothetical protein